MTHVKRNTAQVRRLELEENGVGGPVGGVSRSRSIGVGGWSLEVGGSRIVVRGRSWRRDARGRVCGWEAGARRLACISPADNWPANCHIRPLDSELRSLDNAPPRMRLRAKWPATQSGLCLAGETLPPIPGSAPGQPRRRSSLNLRPHSGTRHFSLGSVRFKEGVDQEKERRSGRGAGRSVGGRG
jgi:hypothetical protein